MAQPAPTSTSAAAPTRAGGEQEDDELPIDPRSSMPERSLSTDTMVTPSQPGKAIVDARSDIYSASLPRPAPERGGVLPAKVTLGGAGVIELVRVVGKSGCIEAAIYGPDGGACVGGDTAITQAGGISGITAHDRSLFLVGVFLATRPPASPPATLDFSAAARGVAFRELGPELGQVFFIGDGRTGTGQGELQRFVVPAGATHLYLGFADASGFQGDPGSYRDNTGGLAVTLVLRAR